MSLFLKFFVAQSSCLEGEESTEESDASLWEEPSSEKDLPSTSKASENLKGEDNFPYVASACTVKRGKRKWDQHAFCLYCGERQTKLFRHLRRIHPEELLVAEAMVKDESSPRKKKSKGNPVWRKIKKLGNHEHNQKVYKGEARELMVSKRPQHGASTDIDQFVPCSDCFGYYNVSSLWVHKKSCNARKLADQKGNHHVKSGRSLMC